MEDKLPEVIGLFRCESEGDIKWSDDTTNSLAVYIRTPEKQSTPEELKAAVEWGEKYVANSDDIKSKHIKTLIHHATRADGGEVTIKDIVWTLEGMAGNTDTSTYWRAAQILRELPLETRIVKGGA